MVCELTQPNTETNSSDNVTPDALIGVSMTSCCLSIMGALVIIATFLVIPDIRNTTRKLVTCLAVADLLTPLGYLVASVHTKTSGQSYDSSVCTFQSAITTYASMVSFYFTIVISFHLFWTIYWQSYDRKKMFLIANIVSWGIPGIITVVAMSWGMLGDDPNSHLGTGPWCWIKCVDTKTTLAYMFVTGKFWEILCYFLTFLLFCLAKRQIYLRYRYRTFAEINANLRNDDQNFFYVWGILLAVRIWGTIRFFMVIFKSNNGSTFAHILLYLQAIGDPSQAFWNCFLFCFLDKTVRRRLRTYLCNYHYQNEGETFIGIDSNTSKTSSIGGVNGPD